MSLASALLKRAYIAKCTHLPWSAIAFSRRPDPRFGKPCWAPPTSSVPWPTIDFNISHQKGLVLLVGTCHYGSSTHEHAAAAEISVDIVSPGERNDLAVIAGSEFASFVSAFDQVFGDDELFAMTYTLPPSASLHLPSGEMLPVSRLDRLDRTIACGETLRVTTADGVEVALPSDVVVEEKLRTFYAWFALKEAFVKLGGHGLSAEWIRECRFSGVRAPAKGGVPRCGLDGVWGEKIWNGDVGHELEITLHHEPVDHVAVELQAFEEDYMFCTMLRPSSQVHRDGFPDWERLHLERDISPLINQSRS
jgi:4'-phosphopantetheinyl transferase